MFFIRTFLWIPSAANFLNSGPAEYARTSKAQTWLVLELVMGREVCREFELPYYFIILTHLGYGRYIWIVDRFQLNLRCYEIIIHEEWRISVVFNVFFFLFGRFFPNKNGVFDTRLG